MEEHNIRDIIFAKMFKLIEDYIYKGRNGWFNPVTRCNNVQRKIIILCQWQNSLYRKEKINTDTLLTTCIYIKARVKALWLCHARMSAFCSLTWLCIELTEQLAESLVHAAISMMLPALF